MHFLVLRNSMFFSITMENVHFNALHLWVAESSNSSLCLLQRLAIGSAQGTIRLRGRQCQRKTKTRNDTSGVYNLFPTPKLLYFIYFWQMGFRWLSIQFYRDSSERIPNPSHHRSRKILSALSIGYFSLIPTWSTCLKLKRASLLSAISGIRGESTIKPHINLHFLLNSA